MRLHIFDGHLIRIAVVALARGLAAVSEMIEHGDGVGATAPKHFVVPDGHLGVLFAAFLERGAPCVLCTRRNRAPCPA